MQQVQYICVKCGCRSYDSDQFQATGGDFAKLFNVQNKKFVPSPAASADTPSCIARRPAPA